MKFIDKLPQLVNIIYNTIEPLVNGDYILVDLPYHSNIGDILIWEGENNFLSKINYKCISHTSKLTYKDGINTDSFSCILFHGGGNIGELYREHINFLFHLIDHYPDKRIIVLPQTINYSNTDLLLNDIAYFNKHRDFHFCIRDNHGYNQIRRYIRNSYLVPDMAFCIPIEYFDRIKFPSSGSLYLKRTDNELSSVSTNILADNISDWPTFYHKLNDGTFIAKIIDNLCKSQQFGKIFYKMWDWYALNIYKKDLLKIGTKFIKKYDPIYTTRLHGLILGLLCRKSITIIDNSYGKNINFVNTWLYDVDEVKIIK